LSYSITIGPYRPEISAYRPTVHTSTGSTDRLRLLESVDQGFQREVLRDFSLPLQPVLQ
jgi:hypothetical protein